MNAQTVFETRSPKAAFVKGVTVVVLLFGLIVLMQSFVKVGAW